METRSKFKHRTHRPMPWSAHPLRISEILTEITQTAGIHTCSPKALRPYGSETTPDPDPAAFSSAYLANEMFSKLDDGNTSTHKVDAAMQRFYEAEEMCLHTNIRLLATAYSDRCKSGSVQQILHTAAWKIQSLLGEFSWDDAEQYFGWGPGATTRLSRKRSHPAYKYSGKPDTTLGNVALADACIKRLPLWLREVGLSPDGIAELNIVPGNYVITVPKNYKTDRVIAIEPDLNMYVQKGIGGVLRRKLKWAGVDLDDQSRNQRLARIGSISGLLATIDLSMASDTISYELVRLLLPPDWFTALELCRSPVGSLPSGETIHYQKFSSMGNGYTFELESLIFWGLCEAVLDARRSKERRLAVYGDDLILDTASVPLLFDVLSYSGFRPNAKKSHWQGPFRESCGKHYIRGEDVSPFYVKRPVVKLTDLFLLHNQFYRWCRRRAAYDDISRFWPVIERLRGLAPAKWRRPRIPDGFGDGAFIGSFEECMPSRSEFGEEGWVVKHLSPVSDSEHDDLPEGYFLYSLSAIRGSLTWKAESGSRMAAEPSDTKGGISQPPRVREVKSLVRSFPCLHSFQVAGQLTDPREIEWLPLPGWHR